MIEVIIGSLLVFTGSLFGTFIIVKKLSRKDTAELKIVTRSVLYFLFLLPFIGGVVFYGILIYAQPQSAIYEFRSVKIKSLDVTVDDTNVSRYSISYDFNGTLGDIVLVNPVVSYGQFVDGEERASFKKCIVPRDVLFQEDANGTTQLIQKAKECLVSSHSGRLYLDYSRKGNANEK